MDDSFPIILINGDEVRKGSIKELTISALERETKRLFRDEFHRCTVKYMVDDMSLDDDDDLETEWDALNPESSDEDSDEDDDSDNENEEKQKKALRISVFFTIKTIEIRCPQPVAVRVTHIKSTTAIFEWKIGTHTLNESQISSLQFEMQQLSPKLVDPMVAKCNALIDSNERYQIKLSGLHPTTAYKFTIRSLLSTIANDEAIYSDSCDPFEFDTTEYAFTKPIDIPCDIPAPTDLQVIALYPNRVTLAWNHTATDHLKQYDFEYYIDEHDVFASTCAATEDHNFIEMKSLHPSTQYTFVCRAKYYDPERKLSDAFYVNEKYISSPTNAVTITTPQLNTNRNDYRTRSIDKARWLKRGNELELFWSAPESFVGKIEYELIDKMEDNAVLGRANKLPVIISTGDRDKSIFENQSGKYVITVKPIFIDNDDEKMERVEGKPYDIQITVDDEKHSSESMLTLSVVFPQNESKRTIKIDTTTDDLERLTKRLCEQFQLSAQQLKISMRIPSGATMDIDSETSWQSFINNHSETFIRTNKLCHCVIESIMDAPGHLEVRVNESMNQFEIDFKSTDADQYYGQVEAIRDPQTMEHMDLSGAYNYVKGMRKPLVYGVPPQHKYCLFRFKIKCGNRYSDAAYSAWSEWQRFSIPQAQIQGTLQPMHSPLQSPALQSSPRSPLQSSSPLQAIHSPLQSQLHSPLQQEKSRSRSPLQTHNEYPSSSSPLQQSTTVTSSPLQQSPLQSGGSAANNYNVPSGYSDMGANILSGGSANNDWNNAGSAFLSVGSTDHEQKLSQFGFPIPEESDHTMDKNTKHGKGTNVSGSSLDDLDVPGGDTGTNNFFANF